MLGAKGQGPCAQGKQRGKMQNNSRTCNAQGPRRMAKCIWPRSKGLEPKAKGQWPMATGLKEMAKNRWAMPKVQGPRAKAQCLKPKAQRAKAQSPRHHSHGPRPNSQWPDGNVHMGKGQGPRGPRAKGQWLRGTCHWAKGQCPMAKGPCPLAKSQRANFGKCCQHAHIHVSCTIEMGVVATDEGCCCIAMTSFNTKGQGLGAKGKGRQPMAMLPQNQCQGPRAERQGPRATGALAQWANETRHNAPPLPPPPWPQWRYFCTQRITQGATGAPTKCKGQSITRPRAKGTRACLAQGQVKEINDCIISINQTLLYNTYEYTIKLINGPNSLVLQTNRVWPKARSETQNYCHITIQHILLYAMYD